MGYLRGYASGVLLGVIVGMLYELVPACCLEEKEEVKFKFVWCVRSFGLDFRCG
jgi:hypothetical protein